MTQREFFTAITNANVSAELIEYAKSAIVKLDEKNEKKKNTVTKTQAANADMKNEILANMAAGTVYVASELATTYGVSTQKISALMKQLVETGAVIVSEVKVKGKGKVKGYSLSTVAEDTDATC